jgi:hypothetical protein
VGHGSLNSETQTYRYTTLLLWLLWAWVVMTVTHELGHVIAGLIGGARLIDLELRPWHLPHSDLVHDEHPLLTLWAGPVLGCLLPLLGASVLRHPECWFVAWFCVVANGTYLLLGYYSGDGELDSTKLIRAGARPVELIAAVAITVPLGYLKIRASCVDVITGKTPALSRRGLAISAAALLAVLIVQSSAATLVQSFL